MCKGFAYSIFESNLNSAKFVIIQYNQENYNDMIKSIRKYCSERNIENCYIRFEHELNWIKI